MNTQIAPPMAEHKQSLIIVDDEPLAREGIRTRLATLGGFDVIAECGGGRAAIATIPNRTRSIGRP